MVLVNIFLPAVRADSFPPKTKKKAEIKIIKTAAGGVRQKTINLVRLAKPSKKWQGLQGF